MSSADWLFLFAQTTKTDIKTKKWKKNLFLSERKTDIFIRNPDDCSSANVTDIEILERIFFVNSTWVFSFVTAAFLKIFSGFVVMACSSFWLKY